MLIVNINSDLEQKIDIYFSFPFSIFDKNHCEISFYGLPEFGF
ncbi:protein of unknown function [Xenorhabdus doucetiae]|uniref:Uncharacterized protein n=1 Tax=Xenorhabdus doucetiae TaxID=351671 RepID=A0A068QUP7_9GAMM|nr:protein of unknown function [Xenorhabdus doucetiae]